MNILYHTYGKVHSTKGGTERTTITVATALTKLYGARCFSIYEAPAVHPKRNALSKSFNGFRRMDLEKNAQVLRSIIVANCIDCVIVQGHSFMYPDFGLP